MSIKFNLRLAYNLGRSKKRVEPLYWVNPLDAAYSDIAELKQRPKFDLTDTDQDGVIDMLDQENETPAGAPVDTRGVTLDSDNDGLADYKDEEPYSPPGYQVSEKGVAQIPVQPKLTEEDVKKLIEQKVARWFKFRWILSSWNSWRIYWFNRINRCYRFNWFNRRCNIFFRKWI